MSALVDTSGSLVGWYIVDLANPLHRGKFSATDLSVTLASSDAHPLYDSPYLDWAWSGPSL